MKNKKYLLLLLLSLILLTGCQNTLKCTKKDGRDTTKINITFNNRKNPQSLYIYNKKYFSLENANLDFYYYDQKEQLEKFEENNNIKTKVYKNNYYVISEIDMTLKNIDKESIETLALIPFKNLTTKENIKKYYETKNYSCK